MSKFDDAKWHWNSTPSALEDEVRWQIAAVHIGIFVKWLIERDWLATDAYGGDAKVAALVNNAVSDVKDGRKSSAEYVMEFMDGKFGDEDVRPEGLPFVRAFYGDDGMYLDDYADENGDNLFESLETATDFIKIKPVIDARLRQFEEFGSGAVTKRNGEAPKPWNHSQGIVDRLSNWFKRQ